MSAPKLSDRTTQWFLAGIILFSLVTRVYRLSVPPSYVFDEVYHAVTAKLYARNDPAGYEWWHPAPEPNTAIEWLHPPIAKLTQAVGILFFGENSYGWRVSSAAFGAGVVWLTYELARRLTNSRMIGLVAAGFAALDGLLLVQSRIAMNDIHLTFFVLASLISYWRWKETPNGKNLLIAGVFAGLSVATKWTGIFVLGIFFIDQVLAWLQVKKLPKVKMLARMVIAWLVVPTLVYLASYTQFWLQGHSWDQFRELHRQTWEYQVNLKAQHGYQSTPLQWVLDLRPVWMYVDRDTPGYVANMYNLGNPVVFWLGFGAMWLLLLRLAKKWRPEYAFLLLAYLIIWLPWAFSPRIMFFYHYTPAVPLLAITLAIFTAPLMRTKHRRMRVAAWSILAAAAVWFLLFYPHLTAMPVPATFADTFYFVIPGWR